MKALYVLQFGTLQLLTLLIPSIPTCCLKAKRLLVIPPKVYIDNEANFLPCYGYAELGLHVILKNKLIDYMFYPFPLQVFINRPLSDHIVCFYDVYF